MADSYFDLFLGYSVIWGLVVVYVFRLMAEQRVLKRGLDHIERQLEAKQSS